MLPLGTHWQSIHPDIRRSEIQFPVKPFFCLLHFLTQIMNVTQQIKTFTYTICCINWNHPNNSVNKQIEKSFLASVKVLLCW